MNRKTLEARREELTKILTHLKEQFIAATGRLAEIDELISKDDEEK